MRRLLRATRLPPLWQRDLRLVVVLRVPITLSVSTFTRQLRLLTRIGRCVSLDAVADGQPLGKVNFVLLIDAPIVAQVGTSLIDRGLPFAVCAPAPSNERRTPSPIRFVNAGEPDHQNVAGSRDLAMADIQRSSDAWHQATGAVPRYYTVPFAAPDLGLAIDVHEALRARGYRGVIWPGRGANVIRTAFVDRLVNLTAVPMPTSVRALSSLLARELRGAHDSLLAVLPAPGGAVPWTIEAGDLPDRALAFENVMRETREYASSPAFYRYLFTSNIHKGARPDYHAVSANGRIIAIGYNFHSRYSLDRTGVDGVYWSSWRKLPGSPPDASGFALMRALSAEPIVGAYHPSAIAQDALKARSWKKVAVAVHTLTVRDALRRVGQAATPADVREHTAYHPSMDPLVATLASAFRFTIERSPQFYRWRYDEYPLAEARYWVLHEGAHAVAYFVTLRLGGTMSVSDFCCRSVTPFASLLRHVLATCRASGIKRLVVETSLAEFAQYLIDAGASVAHAHNYYHFNRARLSPAARALAAQWDTLTFHETQASGDVLLR